MSMLEFLFSNYWDYLGRIRRYGLVGESVPLGTLRFQMPMTGRMILCLPHGCISRCKSSTSAPVCLLPCSPPWWPSGRVSLNKLSCKLPWPCVFPHIYTKVTKTLALTTTERGSCETYYNILHYVPSVSLLIPNQFHILVIINGISVSSDTYYHYQTLIKSVSFEPITRFNDWPI